MKISVFHIGKTKSQNLLNLSDDYMKRIGHYCAVEEEVFKSDDQVLKSVDSTDYLVVLDEKGKNVSSEGLSELFLKHMNEATKKIVFFIGGADGVLPQIKKRANFILSLSKMTMMHEIALVVLMEQIYRAFTIIRNEPYHRG